MQTLNWYVKRTLLMSRKEIFWRLTSMSNALLEAYRVKFNLIPKATYSEITHDESIFKGGFTVFKGNISEYDSDWIEPLIIQSDAILVNKLSYFDLENDSLGNPINWHKDHSAEIESSRKSVSAVNYRDFKRNGDCKLVWEPNRHHQLVIVARAYKVTGQSKYAEGVVAIIQSWLDQNPYGYGMNWRSPLELAIRLINWVWAIDLITDSGLVCGNFKRQLLDSVYLHCRDINSKFSQGTSANNHLVGEAAGLYIASSYFNEFTDSGRWQQRSQDILEREIEAQTFSDGCSKEHAFSYQFFVCQFYLLSGLVGKWQRSPFTAKYWDILKQQYQFILDIAEGGNRYPMLGDQDDGYVLDLGSHVHDVESVHDLASHVYEDIGVNCLAVNHEPSFWLFNQRTESNKQIKNLAGGLISKAFDESGYYLLQGTCPERGESASILFDCADLGYTAIAAHGHADALSVVVRINNHDLFVDTGTYDYFTYPEWRSYFRSTKAHNTIEIDGLDQSVMSGPFMWEKHAESKCIDWKPTDVGGVIIASHNGYERLAEPLTHYRNTMLDIVESKIVISDHLKSQGKHTVSIYYHFGEECQNIELKGNICSLVLGDRKITLLLPELLTATIVEGDSHSTNPSLGWISRGYHQKESISTLVLSGIITRNETFDLKISW